MDDALDSRVRIALGIVQDYYFEILEVDATDAARVRVEYRTLEGDCPPQERNRGTLYLVEGEPKAPDEVQVTLTGEGWAGIFPLVLYVARLFGKEPIEGSWSCV